MSPKHVPYFKAQNRIALRVTSKIGNLIDSTLTK